jgi:hypothetical protein
VSGTSCNFCNLLYPHIAMLGEESAEKDALRRFPILLPSRTNVTSLLLRVLHHRRLVHHVPVAVRDDLFEVIGEKFAANVNSEGRKKDGRENRWRANEVETSGRRKAEMR